MQVVGGYEFGSNLIKVAGGSLWVAVLETPDEIEFAQRDLGLTPYQVEGETTLCAYVSEQKGEVDTFALTFEAKAFK